jgi:hypothetical protein
MREDDTKTATPARNFTALKVLAVLVLLAAPNLFLSFRIVDGLDLQSREDPSLPNVTYSEERYSPVCRPSFGTTRQIKRIFFGHMRKAGGSTLHSYLKAVARKYNLTFVVKEATKFEIPGKRGDTLYITHMRDPVTRAISHFSYENRWPCSQLVYNKSFVPTNENAFDFATWIYNDNKPGTCSRLNKRGWKCAFNCYIRWLNFPQGFCDNHFFNSKLYRRALERAYDYNLIVHSEMLFTDRFYGLKIERMLGTRGLVGHKQTIFCSRESKRANQLVPLTIAENTLQDLYDLNRPDYALYNELVNCPDGYHFPDQSLHQFVL